MVTTGMREGDHDIIGSEPIDRTWEETRLKRKAHGTINKH